MRRDLAICCLLTTLTLIAFWQVPRCGFVALDDPTYVYDNPYVQHGLNWPDADWAFTTGETGNWHPLTWLSLMLDVECFGVNSAAHHGVNLALHVVNTLLLFGFLRWTTARPWPSAMVAALFAVHPLHVESVAWVSERKDVLSTSFGFLALWAYAAYVRRPGVARYLPVFFLLALALLAKPMWVTFPFVLLLLDAWPLMRLDEAGATPIQPPRAVPPRVTGKKKPPRGRITVPKTPQGPKTSQLPSGHVMITEPPLLPWRSRQFWLCVLEKVPLVALSVAFCIVAYVVQQQSGATVSGTGLSLGLRIGNALMAYATYLLKTLWPSDLAVLYPLTLHVDSARVAAAALLLAAISAGVWAGRRRPYLAVGWCWYLGTLVPVVGLIQIGNQAMADRYTYVPLIGVFIMAVWGAADWFAQWRRPAGLWAATGLAAAVLCILTILTITQVRFWIDSQSLFTHALEVTKDNALVHANLASVLEARAETRPAAIEHYREALRILPQLADARYSLAVALSEEGRLGEAIQQYGDLLKSQPDDSRAHNGLGRCLAISGSKDGAVDQFQLAVKFDPNNAEAYNNLGMALAETGRTPAAINAFRQAAVLAAAQGKSELAKSCLAGLKLYEAGEEGVKH